MALERGVVDYREARAIQRDLERRGKHYKISDQVSVALIVDLNLAVTDPSAAQAKNLVRKFEEFQLYETDGSNGTPSQGQGDTT
ncbi:C6 zinc finger domain containing protein [Colletotrichum tofieldiae]|nr:C6 zinc finger domain containing protein [Colletotrichum tofieldiae]